MNVSEIKDPACLQSLDEKELKKLIIHCLNQKQKNLKIKNKKNW